MNKIGEKVHFNDSQIEVKYVEEKSSARKNGCSELVNISKVSQNDETFMLFADGTMDGKRINRNPAIEEKRPHGVYGVYNIFITSIVVLLSLQGFIVLFFQQQNENIVSQCKEGKDSLQTQLYQLQRDLIELKQLSINGVNLKLQSMVNENATIRKSSVISNDVFEVSAVSSIKNKETLKSIFGRTSVQNSSSDSDNYSSETGQKNINFQIIETPVRRTIYSSNANLHLKIPYPHTNAARGEQAQLKSSFRPMNSQFPQDIAAKSQSQSQLLRNKNADDMTPDGSKTRRRRFVAQTMYSEGNQDQDVTARLKDSPLPSRVSRVTHPWLALTAFSNIPV